MDDDVGTSARRPRALKIFAACLVVAACYGILADGLSLWPFGVGPTVAASAAPQPAAVAKKVERTVEIQDLDLRTYVAEIVHGRGIAWPILRIDYSRLDGDQLFLARMTEPGGGQVFATVTEGEVAKAALPHARAEGKVPADAADLGVRIYRSSGRGSDGRVRLIFRWDETERTAPQ